MRLPRRKDRWADGFTLPAPGRGVKALRRAPFDGLRASPSTGSGQAGRMVGELAHRSGHRPMRVGQCTCLACVVPLRRSGGHLGGGASRSEAEMPSVPPEVAFFKGRAPQGRWRNGGAVGPSFLSPLRGSAREKAPVPGAVAPGQMLWAPFGAQQPTAGGHNAKHVRASWPTRR